MCGFYLLGCVLDLEFRSFRDYNAYLLIILLLCVLMFACFTCYGIKKKCRTVVCANVATLVVLCMILSLASLKPR